MRADSFDALPRSAHGLLLAELWAQKLPQHLVYIACHDAAMAEIAEQLACFAPDARVLTLPAWDVMPYDRVSPDTALMAARLHTLRQLADGKERYLLLTTVNAVLQRVMAPESLPAALPAMRAGELIPMERFIKMLVQQGYRRSGRAMEPGEFAVRGSLMDVVPAGGSEGVRLDWFGDRLETIRRYEVMSQASQGTLPEFQLSATSEVMLGEASIARFRSCYRESLSSKVKDQSLYEAISAGQSYPGMEHFLPWFEPRMADLTEYTQDACWYMDGEVASAASERLETIADYYQARRRDAELPVLPPEQLFLTAPEWENRLLACTVRFSSLASGQGVDLGIRPIFPFRQQAGAPSPFEQLHALHDTQKTLILACHSAGSRERLQALLLERGMHAVAAEGWKQARRARGKSIQLLELPLETGFETPELMLLSESDLLGERLARRSRKKKNTASFFAEASAFHPGDLLVHQEHGIGRFAGLVTIEVSGAKHDCLQLMYEGEDKLFLPVENIELLTRYGEETDGVKLDKLGGVSWQARKARIKKRIGIAAEALLKIAAERALKSAPVVEPMRGAYDAFTARFGFVETEDQARAIEEVLADLVSGKPMDRLICGDVGFGKTEVAMRAAFVVASQAAAEGDASGAPYQVALICPTTLLARQHYKNFKERFAGFPIEIRQLSRMVPAKQQKQTWADLKAGKVNVVIGTHALLGKGAEFARLGLVIVDEEQHFGVAQKEKLKELKNNVHVLTLSATPIPRTLHMALTGVRDLSLIATAPVDRLAIRSFVSPFDSVSMREAIMRELHRGGQCFVVTPRVKEIGELRQLLAELVPEAKICVAHGQMPASELDQVMNDFYDGKYDMLLSTAIIESGLDIPRANTMIVHHAHLFGLAQLYQMRGRVGRGKIRAYAYFMLPHRRQITDQATRRLEIMQTLDSLGAGFSLANHDMELRGVGNLVGEEQSGQFREVGIELYQQMLEEAVTQLRDREPEPSRRDTQHFVPTINLGISVLIPEHYVEDLGLRMGLYRRASSFTTEEEIQAFGAELRDRFGPLPEETQHLISVLLLKRYCLSAGIERIDAGPKGAVLTLWQNQHAKPDALFAFVQRRISTLKIRPDQKIGVTEVWKGERDKIEKLTRLVADIASL